MAHSDSEAESLVSVSSQSQHFEPQEDDDETLWEVIEITAERDKTYKVRWKGIDPRTEKPWAQSWVPKKDCTDDLVLEWKRKKKEKERRKSTTSKRGRESTASKKPARISTVTVPASKASTSKSQLSNSRRSTSTINAGDATTAKRGQSSAATARSTSTVTPTANRILAKKPKPKTKRVSDATTHTIEEDELESEDEVIVPPAPASVNVAKGKKRKLAEAESAHTSANTGSGAGAGPVDVNVKDPTPKHPLGHPKKKRKVEVEVIKPEPEQESYDARPLRGRDSVASHLEEEEEERMVEDALSEGVNSPRPPEHFHEEGPYYDDPDYGYDVPAGGMDVYDITNVVETKKSKGKGRAPDVSESERESEVDELEEDSDVFVLYAKTGHLKPVKTKPEQKKKATTSKANGKSKSTSTRKATTTVAPATTNIVVGTTKSSTTASATTAAKVDPKPKPKPKPKPPTSIIAPPKSRSNSPIPPPPSSPPQKIGPPKKRSGGHSQSISKEGSVASFGAAPAKVSDTAAGPSTAANTNGNGNGKAESKPKFKSKSAAKDDNDSDIEILEVTPTVKKPRPGSYQSRSRSRVVASDSSSNSDSDKEPPPLEWPAAASTSALTGADAQHRPPTEERSVFWDGEAPVVVVDQEGDDNDGELDGELQYPPEPEPVLSPAAVKRLHEFDEELKAAEASGRIGEPELPKTNMAGAIAAGQAKEADVRQQQRQVSVSKSNKSKSTEPNVETVEELEKETEKKKQEPKKKKPMFRPNGSSALIIGSGLEYTSDAATTEAEGGEEETAKAKIRSINSTSKASKTKDDRKSDSESSKPKPKPKPKSTSSTTTTASASNAKPVQQQQQAPAKPPPSSYNTDIVPETDPEPESQSQPQSSQDLDLPTEAAAGPPAYASRPQTPGAKSSLRSRMKPRTPLSRTSSVIDSAKERSLHPIPMLSPSTFHPHLSSIAEPESSLPESIEVESDGKQRSSRVEDGEDDDDEDPPMSSIEQFESPEKGKAKKKKIVLAKDKQKQKQTQKETALDIAELDVVKRGQEIAEAAKKRREISEGRLGSSPPRTRRTIADIRATRSRSATTASHASEGSGGDRGSTHLALDRVEEREEGDQEMQDASTAVAPPTSGPRAALEDDSVVVQEMEQAYVDLSGGAGDHQNEDHDDDGNDSDVNSPRAVRDPVQMRQEEEESTQDVMMELQALEQRQRGMDDIDLHSGWNLGPPDSRSETLAQEPALPAHVDQDSGKGKGKERSIAEQDRDYPMEDLDIPKIVVEGASRAASARPYSPEEGSRADLPIRSRLRSRSNTPSVAGSHRSNGKEKRAELDAPSKSRGGSVKPSGQSSLTPNDDSTQHRLNVALDLVNSKSEDIARLNAQLASERAKNEGLQQEVLALQPQLVHLTQLEAVKNEEAMKRLADLEVQHLQHLAEKADWQMDQTLFVAQVEAATKGKVEAEKDRDFFREQYSQASGYVTTVRDENRELEKRIQIAEGQAQAGVALVKATFEQRVKTLEDDLKAWRKMAEFLIEKDRRSNGDEIRRLAAEAPELEARCSRQEDALEMQQDRLEELEEEMKTKMEVWRASEKELEQWKKETTRLTVELSEANIKLDRIGRAGDLGESVDTSGNGHEFVYRCQWRSHDGHESSDCREVFPTISELEQHLLHSGGHRDLQHT